MNLSNEKVIYCAKCGKIALAQYTKVNTSEILPDGWVRKSIFGNLVFCNSFSKDVDLTLEKIELLNRFAKESQNTSNECIEEYMSNFLEYIDKNKV